MERAVRKVLLLISNCRLPIADLRGAENELKGLHRESQIENWQSKIGNE
jgi:hypothetical protein